MFCVKMVRHRAKTIITFQFVTRDSGTILIVTIVSSSTTSLSHFQPHDSKPIFHGSDIAVAFVVNHSDHLCF